MVLICKNLLWRLYATQWVGLGLWGRSVSYVCENCVSYARQQISYHMHAKTAYYMHAKKSIFGYQYHNFLFLFGVLFIRIFMRPGSKIHILKVHKQQCRKSYITKFKSLLFVFHIWLVLKQLCLPRPPQDLWPTSPHLRQYLVPLLFPTISLPTITLPPFHASTCHLLL